MWCGKCSSTAGTARERVQLLDVRAGRADCGTTACNNAHYSKPRVNQQTGALQSRSQSLIPSQVRRPSILVVKMGPPAPSRSRIATVKKTPNHFDGALFMIDKSAFRPISDVTRAASGVLAIISIGDGAGTVVTVPLGSALKFVSWGFGCGADGWQSVGCNIGRLDFAEAPSMQPRLHPE